MRLETTNPQAVCPGVPPGPRAAEPPRAAGLPGREEEEAVLEAAENVGSTGALAQLEQLPTTAKSEQVREQGGGS
jgi:hypothetical protein